jgi:hypothetical protein
VVLPITGKESFLAPLRAALEGMDDPRCVPDGISCYVLSFFPLLVLLILITFDRDRGGAGGAPHHGQGELPRPAQGRAPGDGRPEVRYLMVV